MRPCSTREFIFVRSERCTEFCMRMMKCGSAQRIAASAIQEARAASHSAQSSLVLGYHKTKGSSEVDVLLSLRDSRHIQPSCSRMDGGKKRKRRACKRSDRRNLHATGNRRRPIDNSFRPRFGDDIKNSGVADVGFRSHQILEQTSR